jgi:hypothetical protein
MRKQVTLGLISGKMFGFEVKDEDVSKVIDRFTVKGPEAENLVSVLDLFVKEQINADFMYIKPSQIELLDIGDIKEPSQIATPGPQIVK